MKDRLIDLALALAALWLLFGGKVPVLVSTTPDTVVYTYEKDEHEVPLPVLAALNTLNLQGILAALDEVDTKTGNDTVPTQYAVSRPAAIAAGLPALVTLSKDKVLRVIRSPTTEAQVLEAVK